MTEHPNCRRIVSEVWKSKIVGNLMTVLSQKLKELKNKLKSWNKNVFSNVHLRVQQAQVEVDLLQEQINANGDIDDMFEKEREA